jgi:hypothetical protein
MVIDPMRPLIAYSGMATTAEQRICFPARYIERITVTGTPSIDFSFDRSITADDHPLGLKLSYELLEELMGDYIAHCNYGMSEAYAMLIHLRAKYIAHCAMGAGTHKTADVVNNAPAAPQSTTLAHMITAANDLKAKYNAHDNETGTYHPAAGTANQVATANATDLVTLVALLNGIRTAFIAHLADAVAHTAADATNAVTLEALIVASHKAADATNNDPTPLASKSLADMIKTANSLKAKYNAHDADSTTFHQAGGTAHQVAASDATTLATLITLINEIKDDLTAHMADSTASTGCHYNADTIHPITNAPAASGVLTLAQNEQTPQLNLSCQEIYFKAASSTSAFKIYGLCYDSDLENA